MNEYSEDEYLMISGIQHFVFCKRQWALIHLEQQWEENFRTADGNAMHKNAHDSEFSESRNGKIIIRAMAVSSPKLGMNGECDVVEFTRCKDGIEIFGREGKYKVTPIEYKRGKPKEDESDIMQLCVQAMCLEDMLCCEIGEGYIYYGENKRRFKVIFDEALRERVKIMISQMHEYYDKRHTPKVKRTKACNACSLKDICLPIIMKNKSAKNYIESILSDSEDF